MLIIARLLELPLPPKQSQSRQSLFVLELREWRGGYLVGRGEGYSSYCESFLLFWTCQGVGVDCVEGYFRLLRLASEYNDEVQILFFVVLSYNCSTCNDSLDKFAPCRSNLQRTNIPICASSPNFRLVRNYFNLLHSALVWISRAAAVTRRLDIEDLHLLDEFSSTQQSPTLKCKLSQPPRYNIFKGWILQLHLDDELN